MVASEEIAERRAEPARERPAFAAHFPADPELDRLVALFEAGDYGAVRAGTAALVRSTDRDDVRKAARELAARLEPDPVAKLLLGIAALLLAALAAFYWTHAHAPPAP
jgi:hypothetical protein